ncbi:nuclease-related domain-containing protein [Streptomyces sp. NPDC056437]|uniref:nuclease-related domain-containing protein n=1 Tax=Streptomyces sp. NPDC056437 TaxID=3345816 RepID=UPI003675082B
MSAGESAAAWAAQLRADARRGLWARITAWLGLNQSTRLADAKAARCERGAKGERATARLLTQLQPYGWHIRHDLALPNSRANLDHVLISPCGTTVIVLDSKQWNRLELTKLVDGRVHCGKKDWHDQIDAVAGYARKVAKAVDLPPENVLPMVVVHGSPVVIGGHLKASTPDGPVLVLEAGWLVPTLAASAGLPDRYRSRALADWVFSVLTPYVQRR